MMISVFLKGDFPALDCPRFGGYGECYCEEGAHPDAGPAKAGDVTIKLPDDVKEELASVFDTGQNERLVTTSIALTLYVTNRVSLERAAYIADLDFTDFLGLLDLYNIPWKAEASLPDSQTEEWEDDLMLRADIIAPQEKLKNN